MSKYQGRVDPIELLRAVYTEDKKVRLKDKHLIFEKEIKFSLAQPTAWISPLSNKQYSLGSLWLYLEYHQKRITDYITKITEYGVENVTISDREEMANYFLGKVKESLCINQEAKLQLAMKNPPHRPPQTGLEEEGGEPTKKVKTDPIEVQVIEQIYKFERPIMSKNRSLRFRESHHFSYAGLLDHLITSKAPAPATSNAPTSGSDRKMRINMLLEKKKNPILIVPEHFHPGNLCLGNIEQFLSKGQYDEGAGSVGFKQWIEFEFSLRGRTVKFDVTNNPKTLQEEDWSCVVGIFVEGRADEFQFWRKNEPTELFRMTKGFHLQFPSKEVSAAQDWNIKAFTLDKNLRYRDS